MEGFLEAGPQLALQLSMLVQGKTSQSKKIVWERHIGQYGSNATLGYDDYEDVTTLEPILTTISNFTSELDLTEEPGDLQIFGRVYNEGTGLGRRTAHFV